MKKMKPDSRKKIAERVVKGLFAIGSIAEAIMFFTFMHKTTYQLWDSTETRIAFITAAVLIATATIILGIIAAIFDSKKAD